MQFISLILFYECCSCYSLSLWNNCKLPSTFVCIVTSNIRFVDCCWPHNAVRVTDCSNFKSAAVKGFYNDFVQHVRHCFICANCIVSFQPFAVTFQSVSYLINNCLRVVVHVTVVSPSSVSHFIPGSGERLGGCPGCRAHPKILCHSEMYVTMAN